MTRIITAPISSSTSAPQMGGMTRLARLVGFWLVEIARIAAHRRDVRSLLELDDRCLRDIGLTRGDVVGALDQPYVTDPSIILAVRSVEQRSRHRRPKTAARPVVRPFSAARAPIRLASASKSRS